MPMQHRGSRVKLRIFLLCGLLGLATAHASDWVSPIPLDTETGDLGYREVVAVEGASAEQLYSRARTWATMAYRSANDVVQLDDASAGRLIVKGSFSITYMLQPGWIRHTLAIEAKDGRYRYTLGGFVFDNGHWEGALSREKKFAGYKGLHKKAARESESLIAGLKAAMTEENPIGSGDW